MGQQRATRETVRKAEPSGEPCRADPARSGGTGGNLLAEAIRRVGQVFLEKSGAVESGSAPDVSVAVAEVRTRLLTTAYGRWLLANLDGDGYSPRKTNRPCACWCEIDDPAMDERATVVDRHNNRAAIVFVCYSYFRSERQRPMCRGQSAGIQSLTTRSRAAAFDGIHRCYSRLGTKRGNRAKRRDHNG